MKSALKVAAVLAVVGVISLAMLRDSVSRAQEPKPQPAVKTSEAEAVKAEHATIGIGKEEAFQPNSHPDAEWFPEAGFGLFLHWGISSVKSMNISWPMIPGRPLNARKVTDESERQRIVRERDYNLDGRPPEITPNQYWEMAKDFKPQKYDPDKWLKAAKEAGFEYAVLTAKHHEGFALWPSKYGDFNTKNYMGGRDLIKEYVEACRHNGLKVGLYFSGPDWYFDRDYMSFLYRANQNAWMPSLSPDLMPRTTEKSKEEIDRHQKEYARAVKGQVEELLTNYGRIDVLWFDGRPRVPDAAGVITIERIRELQPHIVVNPRMHGRGDFITYERRLTTDKPATGWAEFCNTWTTGWSHQEIPFRANGFVLGQLAKSRSLGINYLLGVGPTKDGEFCEDIYKNMTEVADWMKKNGTSVKLVRALPEDETASVPATAGRGSRFLFALPQFRDDGAYEKDLLPPTDLKLELKGAARPRAVRLLGDGSELEYAYSDGTLTVDLPAVKRTKLVDVVQVEIGQQQQQRRRPSSRRSQRVVGFDTVDVKSPDGKVKFSLLGNPERLAFKVTNGDTTVIEPSPLVMGVDGSDLSSGVASVKVERYDVNESYPWYGVKSTAVNRCNGARVSLTHDLSETPYVLDVRAFDDGVAFRHVIPGPEGDQRVPDETSTFVVPQGSTVWYAGLEGGHYEAPYNKRDISEVEAGDWAGPPLTFKLFGNGGYAAITEANLVNYAGMGLEADGRRGWTIGLGHRHPLNYPFELRYGRDEGKRLGEPAAVTGTITTPWRVVMVGRDLNTLVNSTIVANLCPPPDSKLFPEGIKTSWIKPGRGVWRYVDGGGEGLEGMKEFSQLAGELGFEHHIIEGVWRRWTPEQRKELADYSRERGVSVWFWRHSNRLRTPEARESFFRMLHDSGVAGAKIDFFDHEAKELVDLYEALLEKAAEYKISLVFHGSNKPTGRNRTWPNELVRESVKGMEASSMPDRARHQTTMPFTRYLAGPTDYTTMIFNERRGDTTMAHQIASMAVFDSPLLTIAANPQKILDNPAVDVIKSIPSVWDETIVLPGSEIGELAVYARRKGDTWFLAAMCGPQSRTISVPLSFLGGGKYQATLVRDKQNEDTAVEIEDGSRSKDDSLILELRGGGGLVGRFTKS